MIYSAAELDQIFRLWGEVFRNLQEREQASFDALVQSGVGDPDEHILSKATELDHLLNHPCTAALDYFKPSGKWYASGVLQMGTNNLWEVVGRARNLMKEKKLPGLVEGHSDFDVLVTFQGLQAFIHAKSGQSSE